MENVQTVHTHIELDFVRIILCFYTVLCFCILFQDAKQVPLFLSAPSHEGSLQMGRLLDLYICLTVEAYYVTI